MPESKISDAPENDSFTVFFIHLELWRKCKDNYRKAEESKVQDSKQDMCSLQGVYSFEVPKREDYSGISKEC